MRILKFRIKRYKSIIDSGDCYFSDKLTILAGKNECGKTSILEALEDFDQQRQIRDTAEPIDDENKPRHETKVHVTFRLTADELNTLYENAGIDRVAQNELDITLYRFLGNASFFLDNETRATLGWQNLYPSTWAKVQKVLKGITSQTPPRLHNQALSAFKGELETFRSSYSGDDIQNGVAEAVALIDNHLQREEEVAKFVTAFAAAYLPQFILFSSFEDSFPDSIPVAQLETNDWANDLERVSSFNKKMIASANAQKQQNHQGKVNTEFTDKFNKFWTQDSISLEVNKDGDQIYFWIKEGGRLFKPSQRSKGQQWYLSFFIKIIARINETKPNVILIDEPGLFLHAKAQKDLLNVLKEHTSNWPVVFSTHSPYLIAEENLENIRLVEKKNRETTVLGKVHAHETADKETLTPILTAIGLGINDSITNLDQKNNIVVEGPEDVFYLQAFKFLLKKTEQPACNFVNGGGAGNMGVVGAILEGWGCNVHYLYDHDQGARDGEKRLKSDWKVLPECIKKITDKVDCTIADILSGADFKAHVLNDAGLTFSIKNSEYIKKHKLEKVLLARQFLQRAKNGTVKVDTNSQKNIKSLFKEIAFNN